MEWSAPLPEMHARGIFKKSMGMRISAFDSILPRVLAASSVSPRRARLVSTCQARDGNPVAGEASALDCGMEACLGMSPE